MRASAPPTARSTPRRPTASRSRRRRRCVGALLHVGRCTRRRRRCRRPSRRTCRASARCTWRPSTARTSSRSRLALASGLDAAARPRPRRPRPRPRATAKIRQPRAPGRHADRIWNGGGDRSTDALCSARVAACTSLAITGPIGARRRGHRRSPAGLAIESLDNMSATQPASAPVTRHLADAPRVKGSGPRRAAAGGARPAPAPRFHRVFVRAAASVGARPRDFTALPKLEKASFRSCRPWGSWHLSGTGARTCGAAPRRDEAATTARAGGPQAPSCASDRKGHAALRGGALPRAACRRAETLTAASGPARRLSDAAAKNTCFAEFSRAYLGAAADDARAYESAKVQDHNRKYRQHVRRGAGRGPAPAAAMREPTPSATSSRRAAGRSSAPTTSSAAARSSLIREHAGVRTTNVAREYAAHLWPRRARRGAARQDVWSRRPDRAADALEQEPRQILVETVRRRPFLLGRGLRSPSASGVLKSVPGLGAVAAAELRTMPPDDADVAPGEQAVESAEAMKPSAAEP